MCINLVAMKKGINGLPTEKTEVCRAKCFCVFCQLFPLEALQRLVGFLSFLIYDFLTSFHQSEEDKEASH